VLAEPQGSPYPVHKTCLSVMYACRLPIGEAVTLEIGAIDGTNLLLRIIGKGDKERFIPLPRQLHEDLRKVWRIHKNPRWLFPDHMGSKPISPVCCPSPLRPLHKWRASVSRQSRTVCGTVCPS
jgi:integrase